MFCFPAKVEKIGPYLDSSLPDPVVQIATTTQIPGMYKCILWQNVPVVEFQVRGSTSNFEII